MQPIHGLQYRLAETGPRRLDPRVLMRVLPSLTANGDEVRLLAPRLYASAELSAYDATTRGEHALRVLDRVRDLAWSSEVIDFLYATTEEALGAARMVTFDDTADPSTLAGSLILPRPSRVMERQARRRRARTRCWVTGEMDWIYPDDPRLWRFLVGCAEADSHALIVARKVAPATFALLRTLGGRALQYYGVAVTGPFESTIAADLDRIGWPYHISAEALRDHAAFEQLIAAAETLATEPTPATAHESVRNALDMACSAGFEREAPNADALLRWARESGLSLPDAWFGGVADWRADPDNHLTSDITPTSAHVPRASHSRVVQESLNEVSTAVHDNDDASRPGFGRKTQVSRVPFRVF